MTNLVFCEIIRATALAIVIILMAMAAFDYTIKWFRRRLGDRPSVTLYLYKYYMAIEIENASDMEFNDFIFFSEPFLQKYKAVHHPLVNGKNVNPGECFIYTGNKNQLDGCDISMHVHGQVNRSMYRMDKFIYSVDDTHRALFMPRTRLFRKDHTLSLNKLLPKTNIKIYLHFK
jgi:hypothetical protein